MSTILPFVLGSVLFGLTQGPEPRAAPGTISQPRQRFDTGQIRMGERLQDFTFTDFDGKTRTLSDFRGKYLLIDVWGSWCKPCVQDVPLLKTAHERFAGRDFEILGIDYEHKATTEDVRKLLKQKNVTWPNATPDSVRDLVQNQWRIMAFPTLILLDADGVVIETSSKALRGGNLIPTLERVLRK